MARTTEVLFEYRSILWRHKHEHIVTHWNPTW